MTFGFILLLGGVSTLAAISSIGASDSCGGCDATPTWASIGMTISYVLLGVWLLYVFALAIRHIVRRS